MNNRTKPVLVAIVMLFFASAGTHANEFERFGKFLGTTASDAWRYSTNPSELFHELIFKDTTERLDKIADDASASFDGTLSKHEALADAILKRHQHVLAGYLGETSAGLGTELAQNINDLGAELTRHERRLTTTVKLMEWKTTTAILALLTSFLLIALVASLVVRRVGPRDEQKGSGKLRAALAVSLAGALILTGSVGASYYFNRKGLEAQNQLSLRQAVFSGDFGLALDHAIQLDALSEDPMSRARIDLVIAMRRVLTQPSAYRSDEGLGRTLKLLRNLRDRYHKLCGADSPYIDTLEAFVEWQSSRDRFGEYRAAMLAERALFPTLNPSDVNAASYTDCAIDSEADRFSLWPLAVHYLSSYLTRPLTPQEFDALELAPGRSLEQLRSSYMKIVAKGAEEGASKQDGNSLRGFLAFGFIVKDLVRAITPTYATLAYSEARLNQEVDPERKRAFAAARYAAAAHIVDAYDRVDKGSPGFVKALGAKAFDETTARQVVMQQGHAVYLRALLIVRASKTEGLSSEQLDAAYNAATQELVNPASGVPKLSVPFGIAPSKLEAISEADPEKYRQANSSTWDALVSTRVMEQYLRPNMLPFALQFMREDAYGRLRMDVADLVSFETQLAAFLAERKKYLNSQEPRVVTPVLKQALGDLVKSKVVAALFVCADASNYCDSESSESIAPFIDYVIQGVGDQALSAELLVGRKQSAASRNSLLM